MSLDLSVLMSEKMSKALLKSVHEFLAVNGFDKDKYGYRSEREGISVDVYINRKPGADGYWEQEAFLGSCHTSYLDTQTVDFRNDISVPQFQNNPFLQNAYQLLAAVLHGLCVRPNPSETRDFGIPGSIVQLFVFSLFYSFLAIFEDRPDPPI
jgi:hypothetical protein